MTTVVTGSGLAGPMTLATSGQQVDMAAVGTIWEVRWNMSGQTGSGFAPRGATALTPPGAQSLQVPLGGAYPNIVYGPASQSPLIGGTPNATMAIEGCSDGVYFVNLGYQLPVINTASGALMVVCSGIQPDWQRLRIFNTSGSGVFDVSFGSRSY